MARPTKRMQLLAGSFGGAELKSVIGVGGMGVVYQGQMPEDGHQVAVKIMDGKSAPETWKARFRREARIATELKHESIVPVFASGEQDGDLFMLMELMPGKDLDEQLSEKGPLPWKVAAEYVAAIAEGLAVAHKEGIIHRDIKPSNILMSQDGKPRLADFGLAIILGEGAHAEENAVGDVKMFVGTPAYAPPEQFSRPNGVDARADLYALGCMLFELASGRRPFEGADINELATAHETKDPPSLHKLMAETPPVLSDVIERLMAKKPKWRYPTASELAVDLRLIISGQLESLDNRPVTRQPTASMSGRRRATTTVLSSGAATVRAHSGGGITRQRGLLWGALGALFLATLLGLGIFFAGGSGSKNYEGLCLQAYRAFEAGKLKDAKRLYKAAVSLQPRGGEAKRGLEKVSEALRKKAQ